MTESVPSGSSDADRTLSADCEKEPSIIMVEEATNENMPPAMKDLLTVAQSSIEVMVGVLQILMAECGFCLAKEFQEEKHMSRNEPYFDLDFVLLCHVRVKISVAQVNKLVVFVMWNKFYVAQASLMVVTSTTNTLSTKWADHLIALNSDGEMRPFTHPVIQAGSSFFGELLCLLLYKASYPCRKLHCTKKVDKVKQEKVKFNPFIFVIPAICDMVGTSLMYIGLNLTYASSYQMLRGGVIVFVALLSMAFLGREVSKKEWLGIFVTILGLTTVGLSNHFLQTAPSMEHDENSIITGDLLIVLATMIRAVEMVYEEKFCVSKNIPPVQAVGWEGTFGFLILSALMFPISYVKVGPPFSNNSRNVLDDFPDAVVQMANNKLIILALVGAVVSTSLSNYAGVHITKHLTSTTRMVIETIPTLFVWLSSLYLGWQTFHPLQIIGFVQVILGMCLYNDIAPVFSTYLARFKKSNTEKCVSHVVSINSCPS